MRTTLDLPDALYRRLKIQAAREGRTLREVVLRYLEEGLSRREAGGGPRPLPVIPEAGRRLEARSHADLWELLDEHGPA
jgi:plasmid stability protein